MKATKGNKTYSIKAEEQKAYQDAGYDIQDDSGKVIAHGRGKTVSYDEYQRLKAENEALKAENDAMKAKMDNPEESTKGAAKKTAKGE